MKLSFTQVKCILAIMGSWLSLQLGGFDQALSFLVVLMIFDYITGFGYAVKIKTVSSTKMRDGLFRKFFIILAVCVAFKLDLFIDATYGLPVLGDKPLSMRLLFIVYACIEEGISLLENFIKLGVPMPNWLVSVLSQVFDSFNNSTPRLVTDWVKERFNIEVKDLRKSGSNKNFNVTSDIDKPSGSHIDDGSSDNTEESN